MAAANSTGGANSSTNNNRRGRGGEWFQNQGSAAPNGNSESDLNPPSYPDSHPHSRGKGFHLEDIHPPNKRLIDLTDDIFKKTAKQPTTYLDPILSKKLPAGVADQINGKKNSDLGDVGADVSSKKLSKP